jgi:hypothetical protein
LAVEQWNFYLDIAGSVFTVGFLSYNGVCTPSVFWPGEQCGACTKLDLKGLTLYSNINM